MEICNHCGKELKYYYKKVGDHIGEYCDNCNKWIRWVPKDEVEFFEYKIINNKSKNLF